MKKLYKYHSFKGALMALLYFIAFALCAYTLSSCSKPDNKPLDDNIKAPEQLYHVELKVPAYNLDFTDIEYSRGNLADGPHGQITGEIIRFESIEGPEAGIIIQVMRENTGIIVQIMGQIPDLNGDLHTFNLHGDSIHICNGPQTPDYYFNLYKQ